MQDPTSFRQSLEESLKAAPPASCDAAGVTLARQYALVLDAGLTTPQADRVLEKFGPKFLAAITALGLVPGGRKTRGGDRSEPSSRTTGPTRLELLREQRAKQRAG